jgi:membrane protease YdiL (CAAX protease family)
MTDESVEKIAEQATEEVPAIPRQSVFVGIRPASWFILVLTAVTTVGTLSFNNVFILQNPAPVFVASLYKATSGLVNGTLIASFSILVATAIVMFGIGRTRAWDVGWRGPELRWGLAVTLAFWIAMQGLIAVICGSTDQLSLHESWNRRGVGVISGDVLAQFAGTSLVEETLMRGFFLTQFYLKAANVFRHSTAVAIAVAGSTLFFAALHLPNHIWVGNVRGLDLILNQVGVLAFGLIACAAFMITRNLFIAVGIHAIVNAPATIVNADNLTVYSVWFGLTILLLVSWWFMNRTGAGGQHDRVVEPARATASARETDNDRGNS